MSYTQDPSGALKILEENNYYPYGLKHAGYNSAVFDYQEVGGTTVLNNVLSNKNQYKYNGQEFQDEAGLNVTAMDYRQYDNALGRFHGVDALAELAPEITPYRFGFNNPVYFSDPLGLYETRSELREHMRSLGHGRGAYSIVKNEDGSFSAIMEGADGVNYIYTDMQSTYIAQLAGVTVGGGGSPSSGGFDVANGAIGTYLTALDSYATANSSNVYKYGTSAVSAVALTEANAARMLSIAKKAQIVGNTLGIVTGAYTLYKAEQERKTTGNINVKAYLDGSIGLIGGVAGTIVTFGLVSNPIGWGIIATGAAIYGIGSFAYDIYQLN